MEKNYFQNFINFIVNYNPDSLTEEEKEQIKNLEKVDYYNNPTRFRQRLIGIMKYEIKENMKNYFRTLIIFLFKQKEEKIYEFYNEENESFTFLHENILNLFKEAIINKIEKEQIYTKFSLLVLNSKVNLITKEMLQTCIYLNNLMNQSNYNIIENFICFLNKSKIGKIEEAFKIIVFNRIDIKIKTDLFYDEISLKNINQFLKLLSDYKKNNNSKSYEQEAQKLFEYLIEIPKEKLIEISKIKPFKSLEK
jgi:hypothetical protein